MKTIPLTRAQVALVDDADYEWLNVHKWHALQPDPGRFYAARRDMRQDGRYVLMHNIILGVLGIDHRDGNGLNNQRSNLRAATEQQNHWNMRLIQRKRGIGFKGVTRASVASGMSHKWIAYINRDGKRTYLGYFISPVVAARAYDAKAIELFGEFALTNQAMGLL